jgi:DNA-binding IclR family transcriptional regulator
MSSDSSGGVQTLDRAIEVLRKIAAAGDQGLRLIDLQRQTNLTKPTAHRLLTTLLKHRFVVQEANSRRYRIGPEIAALSASAPTRLRDLPAMAGAEMEALAQESGDTVFLMALSGHEVVCIDRKLGPYPIKALTGEIGSRRPLGVGAAGIAVLAALAPGEAERILEAVRPRLNEFPNVTEGLIRSSVDEARVRGYAYSDGHVVTEVRALGVPLLDERGRPVAALSIGAIRERMQPSRIESLVSALRGARREIERRLRAGTSGWSRR